MNYLLHFRRASTTRAGVTRTIEITVGSMFGWLLVVVVLVIGGKLASVPLPADLNGITSIFRSLLP